MPLHRIYRCLLLSALLMPLLSACSGSAESVVKGFYRALDRGDLPAAASRVSQQASAVIGEEKLLAILAETAQSMAGCGGMQSLDVTLSGQGAVRQGQAHLGYRGNCPAQVHTVVVRKEAGSWKLGLGN